MKQFNLEEYLKNPSRKVVTRDGRSVKIHCTNYYIGNRCIIAEIEGDSFSQPFYRNGKVQACESNPSDLFFAPEKHEGWTNIYRDIYMGTHAGPIFNSKEEAEWDVRRDSLKEKPLSNYLTTVKIEWEE